MTIDLPERVQAFIKAKMETGHFADEAAVITYVLDRWQQWETRAAETRARVKQGIEAAEEGRGTMIDSPEEAAAFADIIKQRGRELRAERERDAS